MKKKEILEVLKNSKEFYLKEIERNKYHGMCYCIRFELNSIGEDTCFYTIRDFIPKFNHKFLGGKENPYDFWWPLSDTTSRIEAFNKLIEYYSKPTLKDKIIKWCKKLKN